MPTIKEQYKAKVKGGGSPWQDLETRAMGKQIKAAKAMGLTKAKLKKPSFKPL